MVIILKKYVIDHYFGQKRNKKKQHKIRGNKRILLSYTLEMMFKSSFVFEMKRGFRALGSIWSREGEGRGGILMKRRVNCSPVKAVPAAPTPVLRRGQTAIYLPSI